MGTFTAHGTMSSLSIISAMITPAILILASGSLVASTLTRVGRVFDRARIVVVRLEECRKADDREGVALFEGLLGDYQRRASFVERALSLYYTAIGFFVAASLSIALDNFMRDLIPWLAITLTVLGAMLLLFGTIGLVLETNLATGLLQREIEIARRDRKP